MSCGCIYIYGYEEAVWFFVSFMNHCDLSILLSLKPKEVNSGQRSKRGPQGDGYGCGGLKHAVECGPQHLFGLPLLAKVVERWPFHLGQCEVTKGNHLIFKIVLGAKAWDTSKGQTKVSIQEPRSLFGFYSVLLHHKEQVGNDLKHTRSLGFTWFYMMSY